jgi:aryl-alcohol dehydrogenase-like predicted oxidoreductase
MASTRSTRGFAKRCPGAYVALDRLRGEGVVAGIGIGVNEAEMCVRFAQAGSFDTMLLAGRYSLLEQAGAGGFSAACAATGNRCVARRRIQFRHSGDRRGERRQIQL